MDNHLFRFKILLFLISLVFIFLLCFILCFIVDINMLFKIVLLPYFINIEGDYGYINENNN